MKNALIASVAISGLFFFGCSNPPSTATNTTTTATNSVATTASPVAVATPAATATATAGEEVVLEEVGVKYTIPGDWKKEPEGNLSADNGNIAVFFIVPPEGQTEEVMKNLMVNLEKNLTDVKMEGEAAEHEIGGIKSYSATGTGKTKEGQEMDWAVEIMMVKKPLILLELSAKGSYEKNQASFDGFEQSFTALEGAATESSATPGAEETPEASATPAEE